MKRCQDRPDIIIFDIINSNQHDVDNLQEEINTYKHNYECKRNRI